MSEMTPDAVRHLAGLARIALSDDEVARLAGELGAIVEAVEAVQSVATEDVPPTSHPVPLGNVLRDDVVGQTLTTEEALAGAPDHDGTRFRVTAILGRSSERYHCSFGQRTGRVPGIRRPFERRNYSGSSRSHGGDRGRRRFFPGAI